MAQRVSFEERCRIEALAGEGSWSVAEIAVHVGRSEPTVRREFARCGGRGFYASGSAQADADRKAMRPKVPKLVSDPGLAREVTELLKWRWSPHAIGAYLREESPNRRVSAETIYQACYDRLASRGLRSGSWKLLPRRRPRRRSRSRCEQAKRNQLGDIRGVRERPGELTDRLPGHWEGDLIKGAHNRSAVITLVERSSRYTLLAAVADSTAATVTRAVTEALDRAPPHLVQSLTWDQGREMADWQKIQAGIKAPVYFCDPRSPWQRPTNEHTNGMLRRWLPKSTNLNIGQIPLSLIENHINLMPRRLHQWQDPHTRYHQLTNDHH